MATKETPYLFVVTNGGLEPPIFCVIMIIVLYYERPLTSAIHPLVKGINYLLSCIVTHWYTCMYSPTPRVSNACVFIHVRPLARSQHIHPVSHSNINPSSYSLTHSLTDSLTCSPAHSLSHPLTHPLTDSLTRSLTRSLACLLTHSPAHSPTHSPARSFTHSLTHVPNQTQLQSYIVLLSLLKCI